MHEVVREDDHTPFHISQREQNLSLQNIHAIDQLAIEAVVGDVHRRTLGTQLFDYAVLMGDIGEHPIVFMRRKVDGGDQCSGSARGNSLIICSSNLTWPMMSCSH